MTPTEQQVKTSARLQELGLCQSPGPEKVIIWQSNSYEIITLEDFIEGAASEESEEITLIGPHAMPGECWPEILEICKQHDAPPAIYLGKESQEWILEINKDKFSENIFLFGVPKEDLDEAFRQALISLKEAA